MTLNKKQKISLFVGLLSLSLFAVALPSALADKDNQYDYSDLIVKFSDVPEGIADLRNNFEVIHFQSFFPNRPGYPDLNKIYRYKIKNLDPTQLRKIDSLEWFELEQTIELNTVNDEFYTNDPADHTKQWYLPKINIDAAWQINNQAANITVAVIDTGIRASHQDLNDGRVVAGQKIFCQVLENNQCQLRVKELIPANINSDDNGHGTAIASVIGARTDNFLGVAGIAQQVKLMPIKVLNEAGVGTLSDVAEGIIWATENGADIVNLSLGSINTGESSIMTQAIEFARAQDTLVIAAAGNDRSAVGTNLDLNPASPVCDDGNQNNVLGVAATDFEDRRASFSNYGKNCIDLAAPGTRILVAHHDSGRPELNNMYSYRNGTSFATAIVSGVTALLKAAYPDWTSEQIMARLMATADPITDDFSCGNQTCMNKLGQGRINAATALGQGLAEKIIALDLKEGEILNSNGFRYLYQNRQKIRVLDWILAERQIAISPARTIHPNDLLLIPGSKSLPPIDDTLVKTADYSLVYVIRDQVKRPLTYLSFITHGFSFANVRVLPDDYLNGLDLANILPPTDNTLIKTENHPLVYFFENGQRRAITFEAFQKLGFRFSDIHLINDLEINLYEAGPELLE